MSSAHAASFDCSGSQLSLVEQTICFDADLSARDDEFTQKYKETLSALSNDERAALKRDQRKWVQKRRHCEDENVEIVHCIQAAYDQRSQELSEVMQQNAERKVELEKQKHAQILEEQFHGMTGWVYILTLYIQSPADLPPTTRLLAYGSTPKKCLDAKQVAEDSGIIQKTYDQVGFPVQIKCMETHMNAISRADLEKLKSAKFLK